MMKQILKNRKACPAKLQRSGGFAMLFTVLVISIMLAIGLGIADITYKQNVLSSLANGSQLAFYQADSGVECGMYYDRTQFPRGTTVAKAPKYLTCGANANNLILATDVPISDDNFTYEMDPVANGTQPCFSITFDKTDPVKNVVSSRGYSTCTSTAQQVERGLQVTY